MTPAEAMHDKVRKERSDSAKGYPSYNGSKNEVHKTPCTQVGCVVSERQSLLPPLYMPQFIMPPAVSSYMIMIYDDHIEKGNNCQRIPTCSS